MRRSPSSATLWAPLVLLIWLSSLAACAPSDPSSGPLRVSAAASLQAVAAELGRAFEERYGIPVRINCAGSNVLARQIEAAGRADVFLSADMQWLRYLEQKGCLYGGSARAFLRNELVLVGPQGAGHAPARLSELASFPFQHLALANPNSVPAGRYAKRMLQGIALEGGNLWQAVQARVVPCLDVRAALAMARAQPETLALVYASDLYGRELALPRTLLPPGVQPEIRYGAAMICTPGGPEEPRQAARDFLELLGSGAAQAIYAKNGFKGTDPDAARQQ